jgi:hypothetical protein
MRKRIATSMGALIVASLTPGLVSGQGDVIDLIKSMYSVSQEVMRDARSKEDMARALATFAPEWIGLMPAGETLTLADLRKDADTLLAIPPERRTLPKVDFVFVRQTGWNVLAVYWNYRVSGSQVIGSLYRDTWVQTTNGWRRIRQEKIFPDRPLFQEGKPVILPHIDQN